MTDVGRRRQAYGPCGTDMEFSNIRGLVCFGILFVASFLLWPELFLRTFTHRQQLWIVRRLTKFHWKAITVLATAVFFTLTTWLVLAKPGSANEQARAGMRLDFRTGSSPVLTTPVALRGRP